MDGYRRAVGLRAEQRLASALCRRLGPRWRGPEYEYLEIQWNARIVDGDRKTSELCDFTPDRNARGFTRRRLWVNSRRVGRVCIFQRNLVDEARQQLHELARGPRHAVRGGL